MNVMLAMLVETYSN